MVEEFVRRVVKLSAGSARLSSWFEAVVRVVIGTLTAKQTQVQQSPVDSDEGGTASAARQGTDRALRRRRSMKFR